MIIYEKTMKERPIIFSGDSIRAILADRKTQTRRVIKGQSLTVEAGRAFHCPHGQPGDTLWVRETWGDVTRAFQTHDCDEPKVIAFRADEGVYATESMRRLEAMTDSGIVCTRWRSPLFLPRWASRLMLKIVSVRIERVREISREDCLAEGVRIPVSGEEGQPAAHGTDATQEQAEIWLRAHYASLWDSLNHKRGYGWNTNPWVWVLEFRQTKDRQ